MKKNPIHSFLYKEYRKQVISINALQVSIQSHKNYLKLKGNSSISQTIITSLHQTKERLKYHQTIAKYLKREILYYNNPYSNEGNIIIAINPKTLLSSNCPQRIITQPKTKKK